MSFRKKFITFCNDNVVMLTGIPLIIGIHWAWSKIQNVPALVRPEEKKDLPIIIGAKYLGNLVIDKYHKLTSTEAVSETKQK